MVELKRTVRLLGISGSLRKQSFSTAVLKAFGTLDASDVELDLFPLHEVPLYNQDNDGTYGGCDSPETVESFRREIVACDGMIIVSPEYNYGIPGVLKNALDWASRPGYASPLRNKPVLIGTCSPGILGGVRAHNQIRETLVSALARPVIRPEIIVTSAKEKLTDGILTDASTRGFLESGLADLLAEIDRMAA